MASRRLALNLNQALRSRAALRSVRPVRRGFATPVDPSTKTESTTLSNGLTVRALRCATPAQLTDVVTDRDRAFALGSNFHSGRVD